MITFSFRARRPTSPGTHGSRKPYKTRTVLAAMAVAALVSCIQTDPSDTGTETAPATTVALWWFDEPIGLYPAAR